MAVARLHHGRLADHHHVRPNVVALGDHLQRLAYADATDLLVE